MDRHGVFQEPAIADWVDDVAAIAHAFIGATGMNFVKYLRDLLKISIHDILDRYSELKKDKVVFNRDKKSELLHDLRNLDIKKLKNNQIEHIKMFMNDALQKDEISSYLLWLVDEVYEWEEDKETDGKTNKFIISFLKDKKFKAHHKVMMAHIKGESNTDEDDKNKSW